MLLMALASGYCLLLLLLVVLGGYFCLGHT
jgi:hypothetical protein